MERKIPILDISKLADETLAEIQRIAFADPGRPQFDFFGGQLISVKEKLKALEMLGKISGLFVAHKAKDEDGEQYEIEGFEIIEADVDDENSPT